LSLGVEKAKTGDLEAAIKILMYLVKEYPHSETGWLALGYYIGDTEKKEYCFKRTLTLNPENKTAQELLQSLPATSSGEVISSRTPEHQPSPDDTENNQNQIGTFFSRKKLVVFLSSILLGMVLIGVPMGIQLFAYRLPPKLILNTARLFYPSSNRLAQSVEVHPVNQDSSDVSTPIVITPPTLFKKIIDNFAFIIYADQLIVDEEYTEAITQLDKILADLPDYGNGYFLRALAYYKLAANDQHYYEDSMANYEQALNDFDMAFQVGPIDGSYYLYLERLASGIAGMFEDRETRLSWHEKELEYLIKAIESGRRDEWGNRTIGFTLVYLNRCEEARDYFLKLEELTDPEILPSAGIHTGLAKAYLCLGEYDTALEYIDSALEIKPNDTREFTQAMIHYNAGNIEEALEYFTKSIDADPNYYGRRYYIRAAIYYEMGEIDLALADLFMGQMNTWGQSLERAYVLGRIAIDNGDEEYGLQLLQLAEDSLFMYDLPRMYELTLQEIDRLGGETLHPTPTPDGSPTPTPIQPIPDQDYFTPTPPFSGEIELKDNYNGTDYGYYDSGTDVVQLFRPMSMIQVETIDSLTIRVKTDYPAEDFHLQYRCLPPNGSGEITSIPTEYQDLVIGDNEVTNPEECVATNGYIYLMFFNNSDLHVAVENISIRLVLLEEDGSKVIYGDE